MKLHANWNAFVNTEWRRRPCRMASVFEAPLFNQTDVIRAGIRAGDEVQLGEHDEEVRFRYRLASRMRDETHVVKGQPANDFLPRGADGNVENYRRRIRERFPEIESFSFELHLNAVSYAPDLFMRARRVLDPLFERVGLPEAGWAVEARVCEGAGAFSGETRRAPSELFIVPVCGSMTFELWTKPPSDEAKRFGLGETLLPAADERLHVEPGDIVYVPSTARARVASGGLVAYIAFHLFVDGASSFTEYVRAIVLEELEVRLRKKDLRAFDPFLDVPPSDLVRGQDLSPPYSAQVFEALREISSDGTLEHRAQTKFLKRLSAVCGLQSYGGMVPASMPTPHAVDPLTAAKRVRISTVFPVLYRATPRGLVVACNGRCFELPKDAGHLALLRKLTPGSEHHVGSLPGEVALPEEAVIDALRALEAFGGVERV